MVNNMKQYIESGILEAYVMGMADDHEILEVEQMAAAHEEVRAAIDAYGKSLEDIYLSHAVTPDPLVRPMVLATIDFTNRMMAGEEPSFPPALHQGSHISDYEPWLSRPDMVLPHTFTDIHARIIGYTPQVTTAIVWIEKMAPHEVHDDEFERFLIVEGTCDITIGKKVHQLVPGDFLAIPLYESHFVTVTSPFPCKVILQRVAA